MLGDASTTPSCLLLLWLVVLVWSDTASGGGTKQAWLAGDLGCLSACIYVCLSLPVCLSVCPSVRPSICLSVYPTDCLFPRCLPRCQITATSLWAAKWRS